MDLLGSFALDNCSQRLIDALRRDEAASVRNSYRGGRVFAQCIFLGYGGPGGVTTGRRITLKSRLMQKMMRLNHTSQRKKPTYNPQTIGLTEHLKKTVANMLPMHFDVTPSTWDPILPYVRFSYSKGVQERTGFTNLPRSWL